MINIRIFYRLYLSTAQY